MCDGYRKGKIRALPRTQSSIAVSTDDTHWVLVNASPDVLSQIRAFPSLQPARAKRDTGIVGIILMDAQIDHTTGLLSLREGKPLDIYCTSMVHEDMTTGNPLFKILDHYCKVNWRQIDPRGEAFSVAGAEHLRFTPVPLKSKAPPYSPHRNDPHEGDNIGIQVADTRSGKTLFYAPGLGQIEPHLRPFMSESDCLLVDGTTWTDDEMITLGLSQKRAQDMGHLAQSGAGGMIEALAPLGKPRKVLIHINNTNPILDEDSAERAELTCHGIEVAYDGMEIVL
jgi:pyrroloquinoline quinone biosynthesis protein B